MNHLGLLSCNLMLNYLQGQNAKSFNVLPPNIALHLSLFSKKRILQATITSNFMFFPLLVPSTMQSMVQRHSLETIQLQLWSSRAKWIVKCSGEPSWSMMIFLSPISAKYQRLHYYHYLCTTPSYILWRFQLSSHILGVFLQQPKRRNSTWLGTYCRAEALVWS